MKNLFLVLAVAAQCLAPQSVEAAPQIWDRLCQQRVLSGSDNPAVERYRSKLLKSPTPLRRQIGKAEPFLWHILNIAEEKSIPLEFALLPAVESGFNVGAHSSRNASGLWQFRAATAQKFGVTISPNYDGRLDLIPSTRAAFDYLIRLESRFDDWLLAAAAYNLGPRKVRTLMSRHAASDFWSIPWPPETAAHVPKLLAINDVVCDAPRYNFQLPQIADVAPSALLALPRRSDFRIIAEASGVDLETIFRLNPAFRVSATGIYGPHHVMLPNAVAAKAQRFVKKTKPSKLISYDKHLVVAGETLSGIAEVYASNVDDLRRINGIRGSKIRVGQQVLVPTKKTLNPYWAGPDTPINLASSQTTAYVVKPGDSLWTIAKKFETSVKNLKSWNRLGKNTVIKPGQKLIIRTETAV